MTITEHRDEQAPPNGAAPTHSPPTTVVEAIAAIMRDLPAIGKDMKASDQQGGYAYRGIEAITSHIQTLMGRFGFVVVPHELKYEVRDLIVNNKPWTDTIVTMEYEALGPSHGKMRSRRIVVDGTDGSKQVVEIDEVVEDRIIIGPLTASGRDNSDKGFNKARTQAYKYALVQTFAIGDKKDDADEGSPATDEPSRPRLSPEEEAQQVGWASVLDSVEQRRLLNVLVDSAPPSVRPRWEAWMNAYQVIPSTVAHWTLAIDGVVYLSEHLDAGPEECYKAVQPRPRLPMTPDQRAAFLTWATTKVTEAGGEPFATPAPDPERTRKAEESLADAQAAWRGESDKAPEAQETTPGAPQSDELWSEGDPAPTGAQEPPAPAEAPRAPRELTREETALVADAPTPVWDAIVRDVKGLSAGVVDSELADAGLVTTGKPEERRRRLATFRLVARLTDESRQP